MNKKNNFKTLVIFTTITIMFFSALTLLPMSNAAEDVYNYEIKYCVTNSSPIPPEFRYTWNRGSLSLGYNSLSWVAGGEAPTSDWTYGCTATSAGMFFGYFDRIGYSNMYTGPANGGVCPLSNLGQGTWTSPVSTGYPATGSCYIIATENGLDGIISDGHVDDYWSSSGTGSTGPDPWEATGTEHIWGLCTADFLGTSQWKYDSDCDGDINKNTDGSTRYFYNIFGNKLYDPQPYVCELNLCPGTNCARTACCHGCKLFAESRGYTVIENYNQLTDTNMGHQIASNAGGGFPSGSGFTFNDYKNEIDNGYPVITHWVSPYGGHTMLGVGYSTSNLSDPTNPCIFFHDTWDNSQHYAYWNSTYSSDNYELNAVTIIHLEEPTDDIPPTTIKTVGTPKYGMNDKWVTSNTLFTLTATDNTGGSGVNHTYYRIWYSGLWTAWIYYGGSFTLSGEGEHYIEFFSDDYAHNVENVNNQTHYVDDTPPTTTKTIGWPQYMNGDYVTTWTPITLSATDDSGGSGVKEIHYIINGIETIIYGDNVVFYFTEECTHVLEYWAVDNVGNEEAHNVQIHYVDDTPPTTYVEHIFAHGYYLDPSSGIEYLKCGYDITLKAYDGGLCQSGVLEIWYNYGEGWFVVPGDTVTFTMPNEECIHLLQYFAVDNLGNIELIKEKEFYIDCTPPIIMKSHPDPCYFPINQTTGLIKAGGRIILEVEDSGTEPCISGVENTYWRYEYEGTSYPIPGEPGAVNGMILGSLYGYIDPNILDYWWYVGYDYVEISFNKICKHTLYYWAKDNVCNRGSIHKQVYYVNDCQNEVHVDDNFHPALPGWWHTKFVDKQMALDWLGPGGTALMYDGIYGGDISIDNVPCCDNTGITQMGAYECYPANDPALITGTETIKVDYVTIKYLEYTPNTNGAIIVEPGIQGTTLLCNKFNKDCNPNAIGVIAQGDSVVNARLNWWGRPDGPNGGIMNDGKIANGQGVQITGNVLVEPWLGVHAEIAQPAGSITVDTGTTVMFDTTGSFAITYDDTPPCCQGPEELPIFYLWDFDDGAYSMEKQIAHVFDSPGTYHVSLRVHSYDSRLWGEFMYDWAYLTITVVPPGAPLSANADGGDLGGYETIVNEEIQFYGIAAGGTQPYTYYWDLGDGTTNDIQNPTHIYETAGTYTATLTVTDSVGAIATDTAEVLVHEIGELVVNIIVDKNTITNLETLFTATVTGGIEPYTYSWDFGDGTISTDENPTHEYEQPGTYTIILTVTDNDNIEATDTTTITVDEGESDLTPAEIKQVNGGFGVKATIAAGDSDCDWTINVQGNFILLGGEASGTIPAGTEQTVKLPLTFALGRVQITVTANELQKDYRAFALGPFFLNFEEA
jgi:PKD repeat protein